MYKFFYTGSKEMIDIARNSTNLKELLGLKKFLSDEVATSTIRQRHVYEAWIEVNKNIAKRAKEIDLSDIIDLIL